MLLTKVKVMVKYRHNKMIGVDNMFVCIECGRIFNEDEVVVWEERHGLDTPPYEPWSGCPSCKGDYVEAYLCDGCDEWITGQYVKLSNGERFCENCFCIMEIDDED